MVARLLPILVVLLAIGGAGGAALFLKRQPTAPKAETAVTQEGKKSAGKGDGYGHDAGGTSISNVSYFDFKRNFIVPVVDREAVEAIVLLRLSLEMHGGNLESIASREPRIRDAFIKTLLALSHEGLFNRDITEPSVYVTLQDRLLKTARETVDETVTSVLLVDYSRQER